jgi:putative endonuclease
MGKNLLCCILTNRTRTPFIGVTNELLRRAYRHRSGEIAGFTSKYKIDRLVYFEQFEDIRQAIGREKQIKGWLRSRKIGLVGTVNPAWKDLSLELWECPLSC